MKISVDNFRKISCRINRKRYNLHIKVCEVSIKLNIMSIIRAIPCDCTHKLWQCLPAMKRMYTCMRVVRCIVFRWDVRVRDIHLYSSKHHFTIKNVLLTPTLKSERAYYDSTLLQRLRTCAILVNHVNSVPHCVTATQWLCMLIDTVLIYFIHLAVIPIHFTTAILKQWLWHWRFHARFFLKLKMIATICCNALSLICS